MLLHLKYLGLGLSLFGVLALFIACLAGAFGHTVQLGTIAVSGSLVILFIAWVMGAILHGAVVDERNIP
jgi:hypothetical protein